MKKLIILLMGMVISQLGAQTITNYTTNDGLISDFVECIDVDGNNDIWFGTSVGVQELNLLAFSWETYNLASHSTSGMVSENIRDGLCDSSLSPL